MPDIIHEEGNFVWTYCDHCLQLLGIKRWLVKSKKPDYVLAIEDGHRIYELTPIIFHPKHYFHYEPGCERASWHILPRFQGEDDGAE